MSVTVDNFFADFAKQAEQFAQRLLQNPQTNARLASGVMVILILLISWSAADLAWQILYQPTLQAPPPPRVNVAATTTNQSAPKLAQVSRLHLFGKAGEIIAAPAPSEKPVDAPETRLSLTLQGVLASDKQGNSLAIIAEKGKPAKVYAPGDKLPGGATVHQIYADRVILSRAGQLETLPLKIKKAEIGKQARSSRKARPIRRSPGQVQRASGGDRVEKLRQQLRSNPQELWKNIRITPVMGKDGSIEGYYFRHNDRKAMQELGLQPQDVITAVNGQPVTDMNAMMNLMKDIQNAPQLSLDIRRNGIDQTIMINLN